MFGRLNAIIGIGLCLKQCCCGGYSDGCKGRGGRIPYSVVIVVVVIEEVVVEEALYIYSAFL